MPSNMTPVEKSIFKALKEKRLIRFCNENTEVFKAEQDHIVLMTENDVCYKVILPMDMEHSDLIKNEHENEPDWEYVIVLSRPAKIVKIEK